MHELAWKNEYLIGNPLIDKEHRHLFEIAAESLKPVMPEERKKKVRDTIIKLNDYMKVHFKDEESLMRTIEYPFLKEHVRIHKQIIETIQSMIGSLATTSLKEFEKNLAFIIDSALVRHILEEDVKIQKFYDEKQGQRHVIHWTQDMSTGNEELDNEHLKLFEIANKTFARSQEGASKEELEKLVNELLAYFEAHFKHEESYMQEIEYPHFQKHKETHEKILHKMKEFIKKISIVDTKMFEIELAVIVERTVVEHIVRSDVRIRNFLKDNKMSLDLENKEA